MSSKTITLQTYFTYTLKEGRYLKGNKLFSFFQLDLSAKNLDEFL